MVPVEFPRATAPVGQLEPYLHPPPPLPPEMADFKLFVAPDPPPYAVSAELVSVGTVIDAEPVALNVMEESDPFACAVPGIKGVLSTSLSSKDLERQEGLLLGNLPKAGGRELF